jgi:hypothetical protein
MTPLINAVCWGKFELAKYLIEKGADIHHQSNAYSDREKHLCLQLKNTYGMKDTRLKTEKTARRSLIFCAVSGPPVEHSSTDCHQSFLFVTRP